jgi:pyruvate/2-oxoglutarate dehydrogenase complex dihydrolipoamide dehydrogenase (E3) component
MDNAPSKAEHGTLLDFMEAELAAYDVTIKTNTEVRPEELSESEADHLVVAVGSEPDIPSIKRFSDALMTDRVLTAKDVLTGAETPASAAICGGTEAAVDIAVYLRHNDVSLSVILGPDEELLPLRSLLTRKGFRARLDHPLIDIHTDTNVQAITSEGIRIVDATSGAETHV